MEYFKPVKQDKETGILCFGDKVKVYDFESDYCDGERNKKPLYGVVIHTFKETKTSVVMFEDGRRKYYNNKFITKYNW